MRLYDLRSQVGKLLNIEKGKEAEVFKLMDNDGPVNAPSVF